ncbi:MAG: ATP-binding cassette domain-containing protein [Chitinophagaceae bacterium]|nr:ATP-binding cassette domain-containing protein [Chitinophagaceae bacterium]MCW5925738.1 ATP-binding cassette domain-containing protein [Chitinophagaceae bacterium]
MTISLTNTGKRFNREWIFRHLDYTFVTGVNYAITGPNGSGKSTLLQIVGGAVAASEGKIAYGHAGAVKPADTIYKYVAIAAPYLELVEEMKLQEFLKFHHQFKPLLSGVDISFAIAAVGLEKAAHKQIRFFSSGMKQRVKLAQAIFSDVPVLLLDEPCTNLDAEGIQLYHHLIDRFCQNRLIIVSSNDETEYRFCTEKINMKDFKG